MIYERLVFEVVNSPAFQAYLEKAANAAQIPDNDTPKDPTFGCCVAIIGTISFAIFVATRKNKLPEGYKSSRQESYTPSWKKSPISEYIDIPRGQGINMIREAIKQSRDDYYAHIRDISNKAEVGWPGPKLTSTHDANAYQQAEWDRIRETINSNFAHLIKGSKLPQYENQTGSLIAAGERYDGYIQEKARQELRKMLKEIETKFMQIGPRPVTTRGGTSNVTHENRMRRGLGLLGLINSMPRRDEENDDDNIIDSNLY